MIPLRMQLCVAMVAVIAVGSSGALADSEAVRDPNDSAGRLDVNVLRHGHTSSGDLKHTIRTREGWSKRRFAREGNIFIFFSYVGDSCADAWVWIDTKDGELRGRWQGYDPLGCPNSSDDSGGFNDEMREVAVRKPRNDRVVVVIPRTFFPNRTDAYRWSVTTTWSCETPCGDNAPDRENADRTKIRHDLSAPPP